jgi:two-component system, LuxR family, sensor kinase FixL
MSIVKYLRDAAVFAPCYIALDWASYIAPLGPFNITPWNPQPALAIAWMLLGGLHHAPVILATVFCADVFVRHAPGGYAITLLSAVSLTLGYSAIAWTLRNLQRFDARLHSIRDLSVFVITVLAGAAVAGGLFVAVLKSGEVLFAPSFLEAWIRFWLGDAVGILVTAPLLIVAADRDRRRALAALARRPETAAQVVVLLVTLWLIFGGMEGDPSRHFYFLFVPLIWIAVRDGMIGAIAAMAIVQLGVVAGVHRDGAGTFPVVELQALVATLSLTALFLGVMVDERRRAAEAYRQTLRLAAAGEMAGAIAHEVNQPLTAVANYGEAALMLLARGGEDLNTLRATLDKILSEAQRASDVVRRLRDFFRMGTTRLETVPTEELLQSIHRIGLQVIGTRSVELEVGTEAKLPPLYIDRLQIEVVLRNLITNASEALQAAGQRDARIKVQAERDGNEHVRLVVMDNGPGLGPEWRDKVFEPFVSGKPTGLGLGLAISRAIAEAHGGSLEARAGEHGEFHLVLPCVQSD